MEEILEDIDAMLRAPRCDMPELISLFGSIADLYSEFQNMDRALLMSTLKSLLSRRRSTDEKQPAYRLTWVGSHVGTSLRKMPLARLQEIYLLLGYGDWELPGAIRIPGPFPYVRNAPKGEVKARRMGAAPEREGARPEIGYTSVIDRASKEILAGGDSNVKRVDLDVWFANGRSVVCVMPPGEDGDGSAGDDPLDGGGSSTLFFAREDDLDGELERLHAA